MHDNSLAAIATLKVVTSVSSSIGSNVSRLVAMLFHQLFYIQYKVQQQFSVIMIRSSNDESIMINYSEDQYFLAAIAALYVQMSVGLSVRLSLTSSSESYYQHSFNSMLALQQIIMMHNNSLAMIAALQVVMSVGGLPKQVTIALHQQNSFIASVCP